MAKALPQTEEADRDQVYYCSVCGYGYATQSLARQCEEYCTEHNSCSLQITAKAIRKPN